VLPRIVPEFCRQHPSVRIELCELRSPDQARALREGRVELGFACLPAAATDGAELEEHTLLRERLAVILPARHPLARKKSVSVSELRDEPFVLVDPDVEPGWGQACAQALASAGVAPRIVQHTDTKIALLGLVAANMGLSVASASLSCLGRKGVEFRPLTGLSLRLRFGMLRLPQFSPKAERFWTMARAAYANVLVRALGLRFTNPPRNIPVAVRLT
jgi:DNA-binding transcriptional LysR family regulator